MFLAGAERDYAHESTGFLTWHRQFLLWFEWEIQYMLKEMGKEDYYKFRIPYWDWRKEVQTENGSPFKSNRLGKTVYLNGLPQVQVNGDIFGQNWQTICWSNVNNICDPRIPTGQLQRCPLDGSCSSTNLLWPSDSEVQEVLSLKEYDTPPFNKEAVKSFRNQLEGFRPLSNTPDDFEACRKNQLCSCDVGGPNCTEEQDGDQPEGPIQRLLHNSVSGKNYYWKYDTMIQKQFEVMHCMVAILGFLYQRVQKFITLLATEKVKSAKRRAIPA